MDPSDKIPPLIESLVDNVRSKHYPKGQIILYQGDTPTEVLVLRTGVIKLYDIDDQGNEKILHLVKPHAIVPFAFFSGGDRPIQWFYTALTDCDVCVLPLDEILDRLSHDAELTGYLMNWFSLEVHELLVRLSSLGKTNSHDKLKAALRFLGTFHSIRRRSGWRRVMFPVNHQLLADMTGITRESTAMAMKDFQQDGLVRNPRQTILEIDLDKLD